MSVTTSEDIRVPITLTGIDADGDALTFSIVSQPAHGTVSGSGAGVKYTPKANYNGSDAFTFRVTDPSGLFSEAVVSIAVTAVENVPVATPQSVMGVENTPTLIVLTGTDADHDPLTYAIFAQPLHGNLDTNSLPNVTYTPDTNYFGTDYFTFTVNDGNAASIVATVSITVQPVGLSSVDVIRGASQSTATYPLGYYANANSGTVGGSGSTGYRTVTDVVHGHGLPILPQGAVITNAILRYEVTALNSVTSEKLHTYLLDTANPDSSGTNFFDNGPSNTNAMAKFINSVTGISAKQAVLNSAALDLIKSYYGGDHIPDRLEVFFRFNLDTGIAAGSLIRYSIATGASQNSLEIQYTVPVATNTVNHDVPHSWLSGIDLAWTNDYESAALADPDGDGFATWQEYWSGTDPLNNASFLKLDSLEISGTNAILKWSHSRVDAGIPPITIQARSNLVSGAWGDIGTQTPTNGLNIWSVGSSVQGFYRLSVTNAP
jgi:hypothetical protein